LTGWQAKKTDQTRILLSNFTKPMLQTRHATSLPLPLQKQEKTELKPTKHSLKNLSL